MAIKIKEYERLSSTYREQQYIYKDLSLDIKQSNLVSPGYPNPVPSTDIQVSFDIAAIFNSLENLLNTVPGQRFLFPDYGINLRNLLFSQITEANGNILGNKIFTTIQKFEPRVIVKQVEVILDPDNNQYNISILIEIPALNTRTTVQSVLDLKRQVFTVLPISQTR